MSFRIRSYLRSLIVDKNESTPQRQSMLRDWYLRYEDAPGGYGVFVFSKDRPLQLHGLLRSFFWAVQSGFRVTVLYRSTSTGFARGYEECKELFAGRGDVTFVAQRSPDSFSEDILRLLETETFARVAFLVDDIVFTRRFDFSDFDEFDLRRCVPSLRLGETIRYSYASGRVQDLPPFLEHGGFLKWRWAQGSVDWAYPLSVDGNLFLTSEMFALLRNFEFRSPNTLEAGLQSYGDLYMDRLGVCYAEPRLVNIASNIVQEDYPNRHGTHTADELLERWNEGFMMDVESLRGLTSDTVHIDASVPLKRRLA